MRVCVYVCVCVVLCARLSLSCLSVFIYLLTVHISRLGNGAPYSPSSGTVGDDIDPEQEARRQQALQLRAQLDKQLAEKKKRKQQAKVCLFLCFVCLFDSLSVFVCLFC